MKYKFGSAAVIALGGSIIHPKEIDTLFIKNFHKFILEQIGAGKKFIIVAGGGSVARDYQKAASAVVGIEDEYKDYLGIHATRLNAHFLRVIFLKQANPTVIDKRFKIQSLDYQVTIASGWKPGWSTDYVALQLAYDFKIGEAIIAGSPSHVFNKDPKKYNDAEPIEKISWADYRKLIPASWIPGAHSPVDPVGAALAYEKKLKALIINGTDLNNFGKLLAGNEFEGTIIE